MKAMSLGCTRASSTSVSSSGTISTMSLPGCTTPPTVLASRRCTRPRTGLLICDLATLSARPTAFSVSALSLPVASASSTRASLRKASSASCALRCDSPIAAAARDLRHGTFALAARLGDLAFEPQDVDLRHRAAGQQRFGLRQFLLAEFERALRRGALGLGFVLFLVALCDLLAHHRELGLEFGHARGVDAALFFDDAALLVAARRRRQEGLAFGQRAQARCARAQRHAGGRALAYAGGGSDLLDAQQQLAGVDHLTLAHQDLGDDAAV